MKTIVIIGATSSIAQAIAKQYLSNETSYVLAGRSVGKLEIVASELRTRGAKKVETRTFDALNVASHAPLLEDAWSTLGKVDLLLLAHGDMPQDGAKENATETLTTWHVNGTSMISLAASARPLFEKQGDGCLCVISSVAGERGRKPTYVYGAAKAGVTVFCQALRQVLSEKNVRVLTIKPGYVDTPMTAHLKKSFLFASPERVATTICRAIDNKANRDLTVPWFWTMIMTIIKLIPERLFLKLKI